MSSISLILLAAAALAVSLGAASLHTVRGLRGELTALRAQLTDRAAERTASVPAARSAQDAEEIRAAVADALAEERERELAEARAFWAAQEARDAEAGGGSLLAGRGTEYEYDERRAGDPAAPAGLEAELLDELLDGRLEDSTGDAPGLLPGEGGVFIPRQADRDDREPDFDNAPEVVEPAETSDSPSGAAGRLGSAQHVDAGGESPELTAARRRHPSHPDFNLNGDPVVPAPAASERRGDGERTLGRLTELAEEGIPLADVRPGPLGTLDVYVFQDGTTVCLSPGHSETAELLTAALRRGDAPVLMGGSALSGGYALTFAYGADETAYLLADRVIASL